VSFLFTHTGGAYPARFRIKCDLILGDKKTLTLRDHYGGTWEWNLNPGYQFRGHTSLPVESEVKERLEIDSTITVIDRYDREHEWLPTGHVYNPQEQ
jgi:hypothetical protein